MTTVHPMCLFFSVCMREVPGKLFSKWLKTRPRRQKINEAWLK